MQSKKLICILFFWSCVQAMKAPMERIDASAKHELYIHALHRINAIIDNYLKINKGKDTIIVDDIRLKKPLINEWCRPSKQGLVLEILSKVQFNQHSLRYSIRTPWGLFPLIESNNFAKPLRHELFTDRYCGRKFF